MSNLLIGTKSVTPQTVLTNGTINIGNVYRRYCKKTSNGLPTFSATSNGITLNGQGMYHITATLVGTGTTAGNVIVRLFENDQEALGAASAETITTANTEFRTFVIDYYALVDSTCVLNCPSIQSKTISLQNTGVGATFTSVVLNIEKVVG